MTRRAKRPLDKEAVAKANEAFYARFPEMKGKRLPDQTDDPCVMHMRSVWMDEYIKAGGAYETEQFPDCPPESTEEKCRNADKPLSEKEVKTLFAELAAAKTIPFDYPVDCCYTRAHVMSAMMEAKGIKSEKYWIYMGDTPLAPTRDGKPVTFFDPDTGKREPVTWGYHVAPTVKVTRADGSVEDMVIDPSLSDRPLTKKEWRDIQAAEDSHPTTATTESDVYVRHYAPYYRDDDMSKSCDQFREHRDSRNKALKAEQDAKAATDKKGGR